jgi:hypothetical protein
VLEEMDGQKPNERQFIFLGKENTWKATIKRGDLYSIKPLCEEGGAKFIEDIILP